MIVEEARVSQTPPLFMKFPNPLYPSTPLRLLLRRRLSSHQAARPRKHSRAARSKAQTALTDYLTATRALPFPDAEYIALHSPRFVHRILSHLATAAAAAGGGEDYLDRALSRFFSYHPINEFEPFFESIGLPPPAGPLMFLSDDAALLHNYWELCNFGIPRRRIGEMYRNAPQIFAFPDGILRSTISELQALPMERTTLIRILPSNARLLVGERDKLVNLLSALDGIGVERSWVGRNTSEGRVYNWEMMITTMRFFFDFGYTKEELAVLLTKKPGILLDNSGRSFFFLTGTLLKLGGEKDDILAMLSRLPSAHLERFMKNLRHGFMFLFEIKMEPEDIIGILTNHTELIGSRALLSPKTVMVLRSTGMNRLRMAIVENPDCLKGFARGKKISRLPSCFDPKASMLDKRRFLCRLGLVEGSEEMKKALKVYRGKGSELQDRYDFFLSYGLDGNDVSSMAIKAPHLFNQKIDVLRRKIDFLVNGLGHPVTLLVKYPQYLNHTVERVKLRVLMYNWLKERGKVNPNLALGSIIPQSDERFVKQYLSSHPEGLEAWDSFKKEALSSYYSV